jgi:CheY-like chemotaxis protein
MLLEEALTNMGYQVTTVCDGEEAVAAARSTRYDAILMDLQMPRLDGRAAAQQIRHLPEPYCNVSIIAVTADAMPNEPIFQDTGIFQGYETKPINWLRLHHTLARVCGLDAAPLKGLTTAQAAKELPAQMLPAPILAHDLPDAAQAEDAAVSFLWLDSLQAQASPERAMAILQSVNDRTQTTFQDLQRAVATGDQTQILYLAHTLKGLAQQFGAHKLGAFADMCEGVYKDGAEPGDLLSDMCDEVARVTAAYGQKLAELRHAPELSAGDAERE